MQQTAQEFDAREYWEQRLGNAWGLESVGDRTLPLSFNRWMYRVRRHRFLQQVAEVGIDVSAARVLDVGSGTGFYVDLWRRLGAPEVVGSDLTTVAVTNLREAQPGVTFLELDIGGELPGQLTPGSFDVVSAYDMFFHIVDDARFEQAISNLASLLREDGWFLFSDTLLTGARLQREQSPHVRFRGLETVREILVRCGFEVVDQRPTFVLLNEPVDSSSTLHRLMWRVTALVARRSDRIGDLIGRALFPIELRLLRRAGVGPGVRMFACRRRPAG